MYPHHEENAGHRARQARVQRFRPGNGEECVVLDFGCTAPGDVGGEQARQIRRETGEGGTGRHRQKPQRRQPTPLIDNFADRDCDDHQAGFDCGENILDRHREIQEHEGRDRTALASGVADCRGPRLNHPGSAGEGCHPTGRVEEEEETGERNRDSGDRSPRGLRAVLQADPIDAQRKDDREDQFHDRRVQRQVVEGRCDQVDQKLWRIEKARFLDRVVARHPVLGDEYR